MIKTFIDGLCMALADSVPGVSGGTVAFIMGFYDKFIKSTNDIFYTRDERRKEAAIYLLKMGAGWLAGMIISVFVLTSAFENHIYIISSLFMGFIISSIPMVYSEEKANIRFSISALIWMIVGIIGVIILTILNQHTFSSGVSINNLTVSSGIYIFIGGLISISAMFLPGISGSTILLVIGLYLPVMNAGKSLLKMELSYLPGMAIFTVGIIAGSFTIVKVIQFALAKYRSQIVFLIIGLMLGSLYSIVMGPTTIKTNTGGALTFANFSWWAFAIGVFLIIILKIAGVKRKRQ